MKIKNFFNNKFFKAFKKKRVWIPCAAVIVVVLAAVMGGMGKGKKPQANMNEAKVEKRDIVSSITGTAAIEPKDTYSVTSLITGDVVSDTFSEGDTVSKDDVLYVIDMDDVERNIKSAELALQKANQAYSDAVKAKGKTSDNNKNNLESAELAVTRAEQNRKDAAKAVSDLNVRAEIGGTVKKLYVSEGGSVAAGSPVADIYDTNSLKVKIPFNDADASNISYGMSAQLTVINTGETLYGTVESVNTASEIKDGYMKVRYVTIKVNTPFALTSNDRATAQINGISCNDAGSFEYSSERTVTAQTSGRVESINVKEGNHANSGDVIVTLSSEAAQTQLKNAELAVKDAQLALSKAHSALDDYSSDSAIENAKLAVKDAQLNLEKIKDSKDNYQITSPISGKVVTKNVKAGDKLSNTQTLTEMAVIYDMSCLKFDMSVDELDISRLCVGQEVTVSADALGGKEYTGYITNISINGKTASGVTTYPVTVEITEFDDDLIPGMNVDVEIITSKSENVLCVPVSAVVRNNIVYVKGEERTENDTAPEGFGSVTVETGVYNDEYIEIKSGLSEGDIVYSESKVSSFQDEMSKMVIPHDGGGAPQGGGEPPKE